MRSLSSGLTVTDSDVINCDEMEEVGRLLQQKLENENFLNGSMKRSDKVMTLFRCVKALRKRNLAKFIHLEIFDCDRMRLT